MFSSIDAVNAAQNGEAVVEGSRRVKDSAGFGVINMPPMRVRCEEGATLVEVALSALVLLALLFGFIQFCFAIYSSQFTDDAAREATRWAIVRGSLCSTNTPSMDHCSAAQADIQTYIRSLNYPGINTNNLTAAVTWYLPSAPSNPTWSVCTTGTCNAPGNMVEVVVTYPFSIGVPGWAATLSLTSTSRMVISQ